jgi:hypothetical protein
MTQRELTLELINFIRESALFDTFTDWMRQRSCDQQELDEAVSKALHP